MDSRRLWHCIARTALLAAACCICAVRSPTQHRVRLGIRALRHLRSRCARTRAQRQTAGRRAGQVAVVARCLRLSVLLQAQLPSGPLRAPSLQPRLHDEADNATKFVYSDVSEQFSQSFFILLAVDSRFHYLRSYSSLYPTHKTRLHDRNLEQQVRSSSVTSYCGLLALTERGHPASLRTCSSPKQHRQRCADLGA